MSDAYLREHPPARSQYRSPRREEPSGVVVVHTAENTPDFVAFDGGAEAVANFIRTRDTPGSYHDLVDSDSGITLVRYSDEAFQDGTGSNPHAYAVSVATRADVWPLAPTEWRNGATDQAARLAAEYAKWLKARRGIVIPAKRINRTESEARVPGFISHAERDPERRSDPGLTFPWGPFLELFARYSGLVSTLPPPPEEEEDMLIIAAHGKPHALLSGGRMVGFLDSGTTAGLVEAGVKRATISADDYNRFAAGFAKA